MAASMSKTLASICSISPPATKHPPAGRSCPAEGDSRILGPSARAWPGVRSRELEVEAALDDVVESTGPSAHAPGPPGSAPAR